MENLYRGGYIKRDKISSALHYARIKGILRGIDERSLRSFLESFEEVIDARHGKFKDRIDHGEMEEIFRILRRDHSDYVNDKELQNISAILLDKDFEF